MLQAVASVLGIKITVSPVTFENVILGLDSGKYNFVADPTITAERLQKYDMVSYFTSSNSVVTQSSAAKMPDDDTAICGMKIGIVTGEVSGPYVTSTVDPKCAAAGKAKVATTEYKDFATAVLALKGGNVQGIFVDTMTFNQLAKSSAGSGLEINGPTGRVQSDSSYAFLKSGSNTALEPVVQKAINTLIDDGVYAKLLAKYNLTNIGITGQSVINPKTDQ
jgi:polar amino acid transport system substrate-binding protein